MYYIDKLTIQYIPSNWLSVMLNIWWTGGDLKHCQIWVFSSYSSLDDISIQPF